MQKLQIKQYKREVFRKFGLILVGLQVKKEELLKETNTQVMNDSRFVMANRKDKRSGKAPQATRTRIQRRDTSFQKSNRKRKMQDVQQYWKEHIP